MRMALAVLLNSLLILSVPTPLMAKRETVKVTIKGADLKRPIARSENRPSPFAGIRSRSTQTQMTKSFTWSITRSVPAQSRVMYICPADPMNGPDSMCVRFGAE